MNKKEAEACKLLKKRCKQSGCTAEKQKACVEGPAATREKLLQEATVLFAEKGQTASVRDICRAAGVNTSAVNYYFGSKDELLAEVLATHLAQTLELFPINGGVAEDAPVEERLYGFIRNFIARLILGEGPQDSDNKLRGLLSEGFSAPSAAFAPYAKKHRLLHKDALVPILTKLTTEDTPPIALTLIARSIVAQALFYSTHLPDLVRMRGGEEFSMQEIDALARHITTFSIGGIRYYEPHQNLKDIHIVYECLTDTE